MLATRRDIGLLKRLEDPLLIRRRNARTGIGDTNDDLLFFLVAAQHHAPLRSKAPRITQQVDHHLADARLITVNRREG